MGLGTFLSGFHHPAPGNGDASGWSTGRSSCVGCTGSFRGGSTRLWKLVILGGCFACLKTVRAIHSHGGKKMRIDEDRDEDGSVASHDVELRTGRILALRTPRVIKKAAGAKRGWTAGDVSSSPRLRISSPPPEAHFVPAGRRERRGRSEPSPEAQGRKGFVPVLRVGLRVSCSIMSGGDSSRLRCVGVLRGGRSMVNFGSSRGRRGRNGD